MEQLEDNMEEGRGMQREGEAETRARITTLERTNAQMHLEGVVLRDELEQVGIAGIVSGRIADSVSQTAHSVTRHSAYYGKKQKADGNSWH